jgi:pyruvate dehydrogenase E1 component alpha subunit
MSAPELSSDDLVAAYRRMVEIREFEDEVQRLFLQNVVRGSTHLYQGQEAVAVGACSVLREGDTMTCTYRGHGAVLAMGAPADRSLAEILGKAGGLCGGKGGSMHLTDVSRGILGSFAVVGANLPVTCGAALSARYRGTDAVSLAFFGDGATNIGAFHEALNLAAIWKLPAIFVCENNLYGEYSPIASTTPIDRLADRAVSYGMAASQVDGNDLLAVRDVVWEAAERARSGDGPTLIEALTYRHRGHSRTDPATYRPEGELERWLERDPIVLFERVLVDRGVATGDELSTVRKDVEREIQRISEDVRGWPDPEPASRFEDVFV